MTAIEFVPSFADPAGSPIRELFPFLSRPGMISFAGGYPSTSLFNAAGLQSAAHAALADPSSSLQYSATEGSAAMREALAQLSGMRGISCDPGDVLVTAGSQQAFDLLIRIYVAPGTPVYVETPAYPAAIQALRLAGANIFEAPVDADGLDIAAVERQLAAAPPASRPKLLYTVPNFSNPCGTLLSATRREALVRLALQYDFLIIEDDPYGELTFGAPAPQCLYAIGQRIAGAGNPVIYLSSLSKTVAPALRVGWMLAPTETRRRCAIAKQTVDLCTSGFSQAVATLYLANGFYGPTVEAARNEYARRMQSMADVLLDEIGTAITFNKPKGGMFLWAEFTEPMNMNRLFQAAVEEGVLYVPGAAFYPSSSDTLGIRLSFASPTVELIEKGVRRFGRAVRSARA